VPADSTYEKTLQNVYDDIIKPQSKIAKVLMSADKGIYSDPGILSRFSVNRQNNSDMTQISYSASDPAVVKKPWSLSLM
jgi:hypothetical protein